MYLTNIAVFVCVAAVASAMSPPVQPRPATPQPTPTPQALPHTQVAVTQLSVLPVQQGQITLAFQL